MSTTEIVDAHRIALTLGHCVEADDDAPRLPRRDWKDPGAQQAMSHPLDERGIATLPDDVLIDAPGLIGAHRLTGDELTVDLQLQSFERGVLGKRKEIVRLADAAAAIDEGLFDLVVQHAVAQLDLDVAGAPLDVGYGDAAALARRTPGTRERRARTWNDPPLGRCGRGGQEKC